MSETALGSASVDQLVSHYADAAALHGGASEKGDNKIADPQHDVVVAIYHELREREQREALLPLLGVDDPGVKA